MPLLPEGQSLLSIFSGKSQNSFRDKINTAKLAEQKNRLYQGTALTSR